MARAPSLAFILSAASTACGAARAAYPRHAFSASAAGGAARAADPRHAFDARCPPAAAFDAAGTQRACARCEFKTTPLAANATAADCARACCGDWNCLAFRFSPVAGGGALSGVWANHDSLRGVSNLTLAQRGDALAAASADPARAFWSLAAGRLTAPAALFLCFDCGTGDARNNRTGTFVNRNQNTPTARTSREP